MRDGKLSAADLRFLRHLLDGGRAVMTPGHGLGVYHPSGVRYGLSGTYPYKLSQRGLVAVGGLLDGQRAVALTPDGALVAEAHQHTTALPDAALNLLDHLARGRLAWVGLGGKLWLAGKLSGHLAPAMVALLDAGYAQVMDPDMPRCPDRRVLLTTAGRRFYHDLTTVSS